MAPFLLFNYPHRKRYFHEFKNFSEIDIYLLLWNAQTIKKELFLEMFTKKSIELFFWFICMHYAVCALYCTQHQCIEYHSQLSVSETSFNRFCYSAMKIGKKKFIVYLLYFITLKFRFDGIPNGKNQNFQRQRQRHSYVGINNSINMNIWCIRKNRTG